MLAQQQQQSFGEGHMSLMRSSSMNSSSNNGNDTTPLPPDWEEGFDKNFNRKFYFNKRTRRSTWTRPSLEAAVSQLQISAGTSSSSATSAAGTASSLAMVQTNSNQTVNTLSNDDEWVEVFSQEYGRNYYFNKKTRQSVWTNPRAVSLSPSKTSSFSSAMTPSIPYSSNGTAATNQLQPLPSSSTTSASASVFGVASGAGVSGGLPPMVSASNRSSKSKVVLTRVPSSASSLPYNNELPSFNPPPRDLLSQSRSISNSSGFSSPSTYSPGISDSFYNNGNSQRIPSPTKPSPLTQVAMQRSQSQQSTNSSTGPLPSAVEAALKEVEMLKLQILKDKEEQEKKLANAWEELQKKEPNTSASTVSAGARNPNAELPPALPPRNFPNSANSDAIKSKASVGSTGSEAIENMLNSRTSQRRPNADAGDGNGISYGEDLAMFARTLKQQGEAVKMVAGDAQTKADAGEIEKVADELESTVANLLSSSERAKPLPPSDPSNMVLMIFGDGEAKPSKDQVNKKIDNVKGGIKYARDELDAQREAKKQARIIEENQGGYYNLLGIPKDASPEELKKAFHQSMIKWHPDKVKPEQREKAQEMSNLLRNAYACLSDKWEREIYDWFGLEQYLLHVKVIQCFKNYLYTGIEIIKHPRKGYPRKRVLWLNLEQTHIHTYKERILEIPDDVTRAKIKSVAIEDIIEIRRGLQTSVFERTGRPKKWNRYFSLMTEERSLDLEAETPDAADFLASRLSLLIIDLQKNMKWMRRYYDQKSRSQRSKKKADSASASANNNASDAPAAESSGVPT